MPPDIEVIHQNIQLLTKKMDGIDSQLKSLTDVLVKNAVLEQQIISLRKEIDAIESKSYEGRKVLHKRQDVFVKVGMWVGGTIFTAMGGIIYTLFDRVYGG